MDVDLWGRAPVGGREHPSWPPQLFPPTWSRNASFLGPPQPSPLNPLNPAEQLAFVSISSRRLLQSVTIRRRRQIQPSESPQRPPPGFGLAQGGWSAALEEGKKSILGLGSKSCRLSFSLAQVGVVGRLCTTIIATDTTIPSIIVRQVKKSLSSLGLSSFPYVYPTQDHGSSVPARLATGRR